MKFSVFRGERISRLGISYGSSNDCGEVPYVEILQILAAAREIGVNLIDTSRGDGSSEEELGRALGELRAHGDFLVSTKLALPESSGGLSKSELRDAAERSLSQSKTALRREVLDFCFLSKLEYRTFVGGAVWELLQQERAQGRIRYLGVSVDRGPSEAEVALDDPAVDVVQIPFNMFDRRWTKLLEHATQTETGLFLRYARRRFEKRSAEMGLTAREVALRYALSLPKIHSTVVGADSYEQFVENAKTVESPPFDETTCNEIAASFDGVPEGIVSSAVWDGAAGDKESGK